MFAQSRLRCNVCELSKPTCHGVGHCHGNEQRAGRCPHRATQQHGAYQAVGHHGDGDDGRMYVSVDCNVERRPGLLVGQQERKDAVVRVRILAVAVDRLVAEAVVVELLLVPELLLQLHKLLVLVHERMRLLFEVEKQPKPKNKKKLQPSLRYSH